MAAGDTVKVEGLREFRSALRAMDSQLPRALTKATKAIAQRVAERTSASFAGRDGVAHEVAPSVKAYAAGVRIGGASAPMALGSEFGSLAYKQFPGWRGSGAGSGYSLFPTIRAMHEDISEEILRAVDEIARQAFPG